MASIQMQPLAVLPQPFQPIDPVVPKAETLFRKELQEIGTKLEKIETEEEKVLADLRSLQASADAVNEKFEEWKKEIAPRGKEIGRLADSLSEHDKDLPFVSLPFQTDALSRIVWQGLKLQFVQEKHDRLMALLQCPEYQAALSTCKEGIKKCETSRTPLECDLTIRHHLKEIAKQKGDNAEKDLAPYSLRQIEKLHRRTLQFFTSVAISMNLHHGLKTLITDAFKPFSEKKHAALLPKGAPTIAEQEFNEEVTNYITSFKEVSLDSVFRFKSDDRFLGWFRRNIGNLNISALLDEFEGQAQGIQKLLSDVKGKVELVCLGQFVPRTQCVSAAHEAKFYGCAVTHVESKVEDTLCSLMAKAGERHAGVYYAERLLASSSEIRGKITVLRELDSIDCIKGKKRLITFLNRVAAQTLPLHEGIEALFQVAIEHRAMKTQKTSSTITLFQANVANTLERIISHVGRQVLAKAQMTAQNFHDFLLLPQDQPQTERFQQQLDTLKAQIESECTSWLLFSTTTASSLQFELLLYVLERSPQYQQLVTHSAIVQSYKKLAPHPYPEPLLKDLAALFQNLARAKKDKAPTPYFLRIFAYGEALALVQKIEQARKPLKLQDQDEATLSTLITVSKGFLRKMHTSDSLPPHLPEDTPEKIDTPLATIAKENQYLFWMHTFTSLLKGIWGTGEEKKNATLRLRTFFKSADPFKIATTFKPNGIEWVVRDFVLRIVLDDVHATLSQFETRIFEEHMAEYLTSFDTREGLRHLHGAIVMEAILYKSANLPTMAQKIQQTRGPKGFETWYKAMEESLEGHPEALEKILTETTCEEPYLEAIRACK